MKRAFTICVATAPQLLSIQASCRKAQIYAVRISQQDGNGSVAMVQERALAMGIDWCVDQGIHIVNVSYSIAEAADNGYLSKACRRAHRRSGILVAAYRNELRTLCIRGFPTVIGVRRREDLKPGQVTVLDEENLDLCACGGSNSIATAQVSAMVGRIHAIDDSVGVEEAYAYLMQVAVQ